MSDPHPPSTPPPGRAVVDEVHLTASREVLRAGTERIAVATARLEKFVVTEQRSITLDVAREDVRLVYGPPASGGSPATGTSPDDGRPPSDTVVLYAEEIEITRRWVPVETARLAITTVTTTRTVTDTVRAEHIDTALQSTGDTPGEHRRTDDT